MPKLVLASTSIFRQQLMARMQLQIEICPPNVDESVLAHESPDQLAQRLARAKANAVAKGFATGDIIIGSDQVAYCAPNILGQPRTHKNAVSQLQSFSGREVEFFTALCVIQIGTSDLFEALDHTVVRFRDLTSAEIENYLAREDVLNCAGSFKSEGLGISLFKSISTKDPTALIGLPMIAVCDALRKFSVI